MGKDDIGRWLRQAWRVARFELRKLRTGRRWLISVVVGGAPLALLVVAILQPDNDQTSAGEAGTVFAVAFQSFYLRLAIFFVAVEVFTRLFRGENLERTLHYYLLTPVRREAIVAGKYVAGLLHLAGVFVPATVAAYVMLIMAAAPAQFEAHFTRGVGVSHAFAYAAVAGLAAAGYGAVFLLFGMLTRNPTVPAFMFWGWESANIFLPAVLQKFSVIHYLQSICPVPVPFGPLAVITEPTSPWVSVPGLLALTAVILAAAALLMRRSELSYTMD